MVTKKSCTKLKMSEFDDTFSGERATPDVSLSQTRHHRKIDNDIDCTNSHLNVHLKSNIRITHSSSPAAV